MKTLQKKMIGILIGGALWTSCAFAMLIPSERPVSPSKGTLPAVSFLEDPRSHPTKKSPSSSQDPLKNSSKSSPFKNYSLMEKDLNALEAALEGDLDTAQFYCSQYLQQLSQISTRKSNLCAVIFKELALFLVSSNTVSLAKRTLQLVRAQIDETEYDTLFNPEQSLSEQPLHYTKQGEEKSSSSQKGGHSSSKDAPSQNYSITARFNELQSFLEKQDFDEASIYCFEKTRELLAINTHASRGFSQVFEALNSYLIASDQAPLAIIALQLIRIKLDEEDYPTLFKPEMSLEERSLHYKKEAAAYLGGQFSQDFFSEIQKSFKQASEEAS